MFSTDTVGSGVQAGEGRGMGESEPFDYIGSRICLGISTLLKKFFIQHCFPQRLSGLALTSEN